MAQDARLLKTIRNVVLVWVKRASLNPVEFEWKEVKARDKTRAGYSNDFLMSILTHKPTKFYYRFGPFTDKYSPGSETQTDSREHSGSWDHRFSLIEDWLRFLKREYEAPELWQMLLEESKLSRVAISQKMPNDLFTVEERQYIREQLDAIRGRLITTRRLQLQQREIIDQGLSYLVEASARLGKKDWFNLALGTLLSIAVTNALHPTVAQDMFRRFMAAVQPLFESILKLIT